MLILSGSMAGYCKSGEYRQHIYSTWLKHIENELESKGEQRFSDIWNKACSTDLDDCRLSRKEKEELIHLGSQIGNMDIKAQENILKLYSIRLEESRKRYEEEIREKSRICKSLGVSLGILITILLI